MDAARPDEPDTAELLGQIEFCCWTALVLAPLIYWLQGPSVSTDQFVVRTALVILAGTGAVSLRITALLRRRSARRDATSAPSAPSPDAPAPTSPSSPSPVSPDPSQGRAP